MHTPQRMASFRKEIESACPVEVQDGIGYRKTRCYAVPKMPKYETTDAFSAAELPPSETLPMDIIRALQNLKEGKQPLDSDFPVGLVARSVNKAEYLSNPDAKAAMDLEWNKLRDKTCWDESGVRSLHEVLREADNTGE